MQPVHLFVEPSPEERALLTKHLGIVLEAVLLVHGVERISPRKRCGLFEFRQRRFQSRLDRRMLCLRQRLAFGIVLREQNCLA